MKKEYTTPDLTEHGSVTALTETGQTNPGGDGKIGSVITPGN